MTARARSTGTVLNLCFHGIGTPGRNLEAEEGRFWVGVNQFDEMLSVIRGHPSVRITFDDGNASDAGVALPALAKWGLKASFFVVAARLGAPGSLTMGDLRELVRAGMTVGSHGMHHRSWRTLGRMALREELSEARRSIAIATGQPVTQAACPYGFYDRRVLSELRRSGFARVYTSDGGPARPHSWLQSRYVVQRQDTPEFIEDLACRPRGTFVASAVRIVKCSIKQLR